MEDWKDSADVAVTVCDAAGIITEMNRKARETFAKYGGGGLVGKSLLDCHNEASRAKIKSLLDGGPPNAYTLEKDGVRKLIYQAPWHKDGRVAGLLELSIPLPADLPHFKR